MGCGCKKSVNRGGKKPSRPQVTKKKRKTIVIRKK